MAYGWPTRGPARRSTGYPAATFPLRPSSLFRQHPFVGRHHPVSAACQRDRLLRSQDQQRCRPLWLGQRPMAEANASRQCGNVLRRRSSGARACARCQSCSNPRNNRGPPMPSRTAQRVRFERLVPSCWPRPRRCAGRRVAARGRRRWRCKGRSASSSSPVTKGYLPKWFSKSMPLM